ncbi:MAG: D-lactate dehydrogenase [Patescibacteria group bacterium]|jgi:FAD/FMN-containing dehydrogenase|nr:D-lactate dehydrogenase [Patescibacteria group bacterium]
MNDLHNLLAGEIDSAAETLERYKHDASIFEVMPQAILYPKDVADLQNLIRNVAARRQAGENISITARNGGTCMSGGSLTESLMIDMSRYFNHVSDIDLENKSIRVQGGVMHIKVEEATHPHRLLFAPYTSSRDICGIGGMIGNNASGEKSVKYGPTSSNINNLTVVLSNGEVCTFGPLTAAEVEKKKEAYTLEGHIYREMTRILDENQATITRHHPRLKKNAAGYPLWELWNENRTVLNLGRLFVGSQGTLGITVEAELALVPFAPFTQMIVVPIANLRDLAPTVQTMLRFDPDTCETFDSHTYDLAKMYHPEDAARASVADGQHMIVFAIYAGDSQELANSKAGAAKAALEQVGREVHWIDEPATVESYLLIRRKSFKLLLEHPTDTERAMPFLEDTIVPIEHYGEFLAALEVILAEYKMTYTYAGHIGDGSIRLIPLVNMEEEGAAEKMIELSQRVYDLVFAFGGSMSVDHNDGLIRTPFLERMYGPEMTDLFREVKELFDPVGIFNPGKKVGGSFKYTAAHIVRKNK